MTTLRVIPNDGENVWSTVQGEGIFAGVPSMFLRLAGCNLRCTWCDEPDSLPDYDLKEKRFRVVPTTNAATLSVEDLACEIVQHYEEGTKHLVITGGEPLLQEEQLTHLFRQFLPDDVFVTVETNCEISPHPDFSKYVGLASLSPKVTRYRRGPSAYRIDEAYKTWISRGHGRCQLKVVAASDSDAYHAALLISKFFDWSKMEHRHHNTLWTAIQVEWDTPITDRMIRAARSCNTRIVKQLHKAMDLP